LPLRAALQAAFAVLLLLRQARGKRALRWPLKRGEVYASAVRGRA
jgi:hypothetical protein